MPMPEELGHRFDLLRNRFVDAQYVSKYYGLDDLQANENLQADIARYRNTTRNPPEPAEGEIDRYVLEGFLQMLDHIIVNRLDLPVPLRTEYVDYGCLVEESLSEDLIRALPQLQFRTFYDHESFCERLHAALSEALDVPDGEMQAAKLWCSTDHELSDAGLGDYPRRYGYHFDCLTCEPLSAVHAIWLDFKKPLTLGPDRCSKLIFVEHREELEAWAAGTRVPDDLQRYEEFLAVGQ